MIKSCAFINAQLFITAFYGEVYYIYGKKLELYL